MAQADIGLIGLGVMGRNLVLNMSDHGFRVAVYNRTTAKVDAFVQGEAQGRAIDGAHSLEELVAALAPPRRVMLMVKAGAAVDQVIDTLLPLLARGDIVIDGGNSRFTDTTRRTRALKEKGLRFLGVGISGGEEGARYGPSIMPGGDPEAWHYVKDLFQAIAAKVDGVPCCQWVGEEGAGHYVKMVHNGIEYGDMQLIADAYLLMREGFGLDVARIQQVFEEWNRGDLDSYLVEITAEILKRTDRDDAPLVDKILDAAGQKGTGKWTGINALELGVPLTLIVEAVFARALSALKEERRVAARRLAVESTPFEGNVEQGVARLRRALYASKMVSYAQGYMLMREAAREYGWNLRFGDIALMWRGGCIIRSRLLDNIKTAYERDPELANLMLDDFFADRLLDALADWRWAAAQGVMSGVPLPAINAALQFFEGYRRERLPANLIQAQRDYFGAHTYERVDRPRGRFFHFDWLGEGGEEEVI